MINIAIAMAMYKQGRTLQSIGDIFGVSRQRISQILKGRVSSRTLLERWVGVQDILPNETEVWVLNKLSRLGIKAKPMPYNHPFDIKTESGLKLEVKHRSASDDKYYRFNIYRQEEVDYFIFVCGNTIKPLCHIIPCQKLGKRAFSLPVIRKNKSKYKKYKENWGQLKLSLDSGLPLV